MNTKKEIASENAINVHPFDRRSAWQRTTPTFPFLLRTRLNEYFRWLHVEYVLPVPCSIEIIIIDARGEVVFQANEGLQREGSILSVIPVGSFLRGDYTIELHVDASVMMQKFSI